MKANEYKISTPDLLDLHIYEWLPDDKSRIKKIVQIVHGMAEHCERYEDFAYFLTSKDIAVYGHDQRGHGKTAQTMENLGFISKKNGWSILVSDVNLVNKHILSKHEGIPLYLFGHSMGSFVSRNYIENTNPFLKGAVLSGTASSPGLLGYLGILVSDFIKFFNPPQSPSPIMNALSFGTYNKPFKPNRTKFDWLSQDQDQVDKYIKDPRCGTVFSITFFNDLLKGLLHINKQKNMNKISKDLSILLISGDSDPVGNFGKGPIKVYNNLKKTGIKNLSLKLFPSCRHEILNELIKFEVYLFILDWLNKN